ncbi:MAG: hypothetical protein V3T54_05050 [Acidobacteriota bacterium]
MFWVFFAPIGLLLAPASSTRRETVLLLGFHIVLHLVFNAEARYHIPLVPVLLAAASAGFVSCLTRETRRAAGIRIGTLLRALPVLITIPVLFFWCWEVISEWLEIRGVFGI